jgi:excisionase family DNA binding protein
METTKTTRPRLISLATARRTYFGDEISDSMLRKEIRLGKLPAVRIGRRVMLTEADVEAYIEAQRQPAGVVGP